MPTSRFSNFKLHREPAWREQRRTIDVPRVWRSWLFDRSSLTQRLIDASHGKFSVEVINQQLEMPRLSEMAALSIPSRTLALVREVILYGDGQPWVYARSIIPLSTLSGRLRKLCKLDNRPLGALLFSDPGMTRGPMQVACLTADNNVFPEKLKHISQPMWGRRSVFKLDAKPLLVSEIFLPGFMPYNKPLNF